MAILLPPNSLSGQRIGISVSESPDLERLGLLEIHFRLALAEITRTVLVAGGKLAYGGHLDPDGYTSFLLQEIQRYGQPDDTLLICLAWQEHRKLSLSELKKQEKSVSLYGKIKYLNPFGQEIDPGEGRGEDPEPVDDPELCKQSLTSMRHYMSKLINGRVLIGGKRHHFHGEIPGLMEEALITLELNQPLYLAGGFGGVTSDVAVVLGVDVETWLPRRSEDISDPRWIAGRDRLQSLLNDTQSYTGLHNGLLKTENSRLAATHRPSDIASLVSLGLGRIHNTDLSA